MRYCEEKKQRQGKAQRVRKLRGKVIGELISQGVYQGLLPQIKSVSIQHSTPTGQERVFIDHHRQSDGRLPGLPPLRLSDPICVKLANDVLKALGLGADREVE